MAHILLFFRMSPSNPYKITHHEYLDTDGDIIDDFSVDPLNDLSTVLSHLEQTGASDMVIEALTKLASPRQSADLPSDSVLTEAKIKDNASTQVSSMQGVANIVELLGEDAKVTTKLIDCLYPAHTLESLAVEHQFSLLKEACQSSAIELMKISLATQKEVWHDESTRAQQLLKDAVSAEPSDLNQIPRIVKALGDVSKYTKRNAIFQDHFHSALESLQKLSTWVSPSKDDSFAKTITECLEKSKEASEAWSNNKETVDKAIGTIALFCGLSKPELAGYIGDYANIAARSATQEEFATDLANYCRDHKVFFASDFAADTGSNQLKWLDAVETLKKALPPLWITPSIDYPLDELNDRVSEDFKKRRTELYDRAKLWKSSRTGDDQSELVTTLMKLISRYHKEEKIVDQASDIANNTESSIGQESLPAMSHSESDGGNFSQSRLEPECHIMPVARRRNPEVEELSSRIKAFEDDPANSFATTVEQPADLMI